MIQYSGLLSGNHCISGVCAGVDHTLISGSRTFEDCYREIGLIIEKKRFQWTFKATLMEDFDDFKMQTLQHINIKWNSYDQTRSLGGWVKTVTENQFKNKLRNIYLGTAAPCSNCTLARGDDLCEMFGEQKCMACPFYSQWYDSNKRHKHLARMALPMDTPQMMAAVHSIPSQSADIEAIVKELHIKIKPKLTASEFQVYDYLYISGMSEKEAAQKCGFKTSENGRTAGYGRFSQINNKIKKVAKQIIIEDGLDSQWI